MTKVAGNLAHIHSRFQIPISSVASRAGKLIAGLHPTPAVGGLPKADAFILINRAEKHNRKYYTGFLGPWQMDGKLGDNIGDSKLFVNLRCAELGENAINIYVGGGLTALSNPEEEYTETELKSKTILSVVENLWKFAQ